MQKNYRKCQSCFEIKPKEDLIKITRTISGSVFLNPDSKISGRSAYVCKNQDCIKNIIKKKRLKNALKLNDSNEIKKVEEMLLNLIF